MLVGDLARTEGGGRWASAAGAATEGWGHHLGRPEQTPRQAGTVTSRDRGSVTVPHGRKTSHELESNRQPHRGRGFAARSGMWDAVTVRAEAEVDALKASRRQLLC